MEDTQTHPHDIADKVILAGLFILIGIIIGIYVLQASEDESSTPQAQQSLYIIQRTTDTEAITLTKLGINDNGQLVTTDTFISQSDNYRYLGVDDEIVYMSKNDSSASYFSLESQTFVNQPSVSNKDWQSIILSQVQPLSGPRDFHPLADNPDAVIFTMTGEQDNYANLYWLDENDDITQLTRVETAIDASDGILSASVDFIAWHPTHPDQFLFRARVRDFAGSETNMLFIYDLDLSEATTAPFFGKDPIFNLDGTSLIGSRWNEESNLYDLLEISLVDGKETFIGNGCHPDLSSDGEWLGYNQHSDSQFQSYTDCFADGEVIIYHLPSDTSYTITTEIDAHAQIVTWQ